MPRPRKEPPASSSVVPALVRYARTRGLDVDLLVCRFGLPADVEQRDEVVVDAERPNDLFEWIARGCGEPDVAVRLGALPAPRYGFAELAARASATVRHALAVLARYAPLLHADFQASLDEDASEARWLVGTPRLPRGVGRHVQEFALVHTLTQCRAGCAGLVPRRAWFAHARPRDLDPLHAALGTRDLDFGRPDSGVAFERSLLDTPMQGVDGRMLATVEPLAEAALRARVGPGRATSMTERVSARLASTLPQGAEITEVAEALHMSARTLQRRLEDEGTDFTEVVDRVRLDLARAALRDPSTTLMAVAVRLGFADLATFSRAFKRWTGLPPGQWRQRMQ